MSDHQTRFERDVYDHEHEEPRPGGRRRRPVADWGVGEDMFEHMPRNRFSRTAEAPPRERRFSGEHRRPAEDEVAEEQHEFGVRSELRDLDEPAEPVFEREPAEAPDPHEADVPRGRVDGRRTIPIGKPEDVPSEIAAVTADRDLGEVEEPAGARAAHRQDRRPARGLARGGALPARPLAPPAPHGARAHRRPSGPSGHVGRRARHPADPDRRPLRALAPCRAGVREVDLRNVRSGGAFRPRQRLPGLRASLPGLLAVAMPKKTQMSRFHIHDDLTAPEESLPILKGMQSSAGQLPNFLGALAGSAVALRGYVRFRGELRRGALPAATKRADRPRGRRRT